MEPNSTVADALAKYSGLEWYDNSKIQAVQGCHRKAFYHLVGPWNQPLATHIGDAGNFGTVWHAGLAGYYNKHVARLPYQDRLVHAVRAFDLEWQRQFSDNFELANKYKLARGVQQLLLYFNHYRSEDEYFDVVDSEVGFAMVISPRPGESEFAPFIFNGRIDRILHRRTMEDLVVGETKTCSGDPAQRVREMRIDRQTLGYYCVLRALGYNITGVLADACQITATKITNDTVCRDLIRLSPDAELQWRQQTINIVQWWRGQLKQAESISSDITSDSNQAVLALFDQNTRECTRYGLCEFYSLCDRGISIDTMADYTANTWHPLKPDDEIVVKEL